MKEKLLIAIQMCNAMDGDQNSMAEEGFFVIQNTEDNI